MAKVLALLGVVSLSIALVGTALANHSWGKYHWEGSTNPRSLTVGDNLTGGWGSHLTTAISDWNVSNVVDLTKQPGQAGSNCSPVAGRIEVCNGAYGNTGWLGIAQIWVPRQGHIAQATTKVNDTYFNSPPYNTSAWRQLVMCQEIAHDFGLDHQDENFNNANLGSCMDYTSDPDGPPSNEHPNSHDFEQLESIYGHLDGGGGEKPCNPRKPGCQTATGNAPPFSQASRANGDVYVDALPNGGGHRITHVFWTLG
jgi:hypothetical protein